MIVAQARLPAFYREYGVPDTINGRFELLVMHLALVLHRLSEDPGGRDAGQALFDHFCSDMDHNLREIGVGDLSVPRQMQQVGEAFYGRAKAYQAALEAPERSGLVEAVERNIYGSDGDDRPRAKILAAYVREAAAAVAGHTPAELLAEGIVFPKPAVSVPVQDQKSTPEG
jgi:cytochrome b pre-mRNA-processing protein 3